MDMQIALTPLEWLPILVYLLLLLGLTLVQGRQEGSAANFIAGGRRLTLPAFVMTLVSTWYGGILGVGEFTYLYGISNWLVFGVPYYLFAILYAFFLAPRIRRAAPLSIPEQLSEAYGRKAGLLGAIHTFFITLPAPYILMIGFLLQLVSGWPIELCIILGTLFSLIYVLFGGFRAVVRTDILQFSLMFGGFILLLVFLLVNVGGAAFLRAALPPLHLTWHGGNSGGYITVWFFIALWTFIDPGFHQRCVAARSPRVARNGILISVCFWLMFDLMTTVTGLYARALFADQSIQPALAFPLLGHHYLPPLLAGLFLTGLIATIMSTVDSLSLLSAITIGRDLLGRFSDGQRVVTGIRIGLVVTAVISIILAIFVQSIIQIWLLIGNMFVPALLLPLLSCYFPALRVPRGWMNAALTIPLLVAFTFLLLSIAQSTSISALQFYLAVPPMYPGLLASALLMAGGIRQRRRETRRAFDMNQK